jgi:hypothetical protein
VPDAIDHLRAVGTVVKALRGLGLQPVLVGGMALVVLGSRRVTRGFDFVVARPGERFESTVEVLYHHGLELVSKLNATGDVVATIENRRVAITRLRIDAPESAYFFNVRTGLRIDLLFDFPIPAADLAERASRTRIRSQIFDIASAEDLLRLKRLAKANRSAPGDVQDIAFLRAHLARH